MINNDNRKIVSGGVAIIILLLAFTLFSERGLLKARDLARERDAIIARARVFGEENSRLARSSKALRSDIDTIEMAARSQLDLVRKDEILYKFTNE